jgi:DNA replication protein DnaC
MYCQKCQDTGWTTETIDGLGVASRCDCLLRKRTESLLPGSGMPSKYARCDFENFHLSHLPDEAQNALRPILFQVRAFAREFPLRADPRGILLQGGNGIGKTHLAAAALRVILDKGHEGRFINYQALLRLIRSGYDVPFGGSRMREYDEIEDVEVLLLDDLGANRVTDWVEDTITELIAQRHDHERSLIVTTNYAVTPNHALPYLGLRIGERATSRLREMCRVFTIPAIADHRGTGRTALA